MEVAGMPHNNSRDSPAFLNDPCTLPVTDFPAGAFTGLALNYLVEWIAKGTTPPHAPPITVDGDKANDGSFLALDEFGNAKGGIRNVWVDVPAATNGVFGRGKRRQPIVCACSPNPGPATRGDDAHVVSHARGTKRGSISGSSRSSARAGFCPSTRTWSAPT